MSTDYNSNDWVWQLLSNRSAQSTLTVSPIVVQILGADSAVLFALMLSYWFDNGQSWFPKPIKEWSAELGMSEEIVRRILRGSRRVPNKTSLEEFGVDMQVKQHNGTPTLHYNINWDRIAEFMSQHDDLVDKIVKDEIRRQYGQQAVNQFRSDKS